MFVTHIHTIEKKSIFVCIRVYLKTLYLCFAHEQITTSDSGQLSSVFYFKILVKDAVNVNVII